MVGNQNAIVDWCSFFDEDLSFSVRDSKVLTRRSLSFWTGFMVMNTESLSDLRVCSQGFLKYMYVKR